MKMKRQICAMLAIGCLLTSLTAFAQRVARRTERRESRREERGMGGEMRHGGRGEYSRAGRSGW